LKGCTRQLCGGAPKTPNEFLEITRKVPFLSIALCERESSTGNWKLAPTPIPSMKHMGLEEFDWNTLNSKSEHMIASHHKGNHEQIVNSETAQQQQQLQQQEGSANANPNALMQVTNEPPKQYEYYYQQPNYAYDYWYGYNQSAVNYAYYTLR
jgi:hypothetical protein